MWVATSLLSAPFRALSLSTFGLMHSRVMYSSADQPADVGAKLAGIDQALSAVTPKEGPQVSTCCRSPRQSAQTAVMPDFQIYPPKRSRQLPRQYGIPQTSSRLGPCDLKSRAV